MNGSILRFFGKRKDIPLINEFVSLVPMSIPRFSNLSEDSSCLHVKLHFQEWLLFTTLPPDWVSGKPCQQKRNRSQLFSNPWYFLNMEQTVWWVFSGYFGQWCLVQIVIMWGDCPKIWFLHNFWQSTRLNCMIGDLFLLVWCIPEMCPEYKERCSFCLNSISFSLKQSETRIGSAVSAILSEDFENQIDQKISRNFHCSCMARKM